MLLCGSPGCRKPGKNMTTLGKLGIHMMLITLAVYNTVHNNKNRN